VYFCELPSIDSQEAKDRYLIQVGPTDPERECAILSMFHGVFTAIQMMKSSLRKYDYVMKTRTDYLPPLTLREMIETHEKTGKIIVDGCANWYNRYPDRVDIHWHGSLNDIFCFASLEKFLRLWDFGDILGKVWTGIPETTLFRAAQWRFVGDDMQSPRKNETFLNKYFTWDENNTKQSFHVLRTKTALAKPDEATYFKGNEVVKYFVDKERVKKRVSRAKLLEGFVPKITKVSDNFLTYKYVEGKLLSEAMPEDFSKFLEFMQKNIWQPQPITPEFNEACIRFYWEKTQKRIKEYHDIIASYDKEEVINGVKVPTLYKMFNEMVDWNSLYKGIPCLWHGDPQPENVLVTSDGFCLLDWREDFGGLPYGDVYYDLAKIYHALFVAGKVIRAGGFLIRENPIEYEIEFDDTLMKFKDIFEKFVNIQGYDVHKVRVLSALIYLNIAPLHEEPYNRFLYYFGKKYLYELVK